MSTRYHNLHFLLEDLFYQYIVNTDKPEGVNLYKAADVVAYGSSLEEPWISLLCLNSTEHSEIPVGLGGGIGNRKCTMKMMIRTHAEDEYESDGKTVKRTGRQVHSELVGQLLDVFYRSDIITALNAAGVQGIGIDQIYPPVQATSVAERSYVTELSFDVDVHPIDNY